MPPRPVLATMTRMTPKRPNTAPTIRRLLHEDLTRAIISAFYEVYNTLGYGFLESVYTRALFSELTRRGLHVQREAMLDVFYKGSASARFGQTCSWSTESSLKSRRPHGWSRRTGTSC